MSASSLYAAYKLLLEMPELAEDKEAATGARQSQPVAAEETPTQNARATKAYHDTCELQMGGV